MHTERERTTDEAEKTKNLLSNNIDSGNVGLEVKSSYIMVTSVGKGRLVQSGNLSLELILSCTFLQLRWSVNNKQQWNKVRRDNCYTTIVRDRFIFSSVPCDKAVWHIAPIKQSPKSPSRLLPSGPHHIGPTQC